MARQRRASHLPTRTPAHCRHGLAFSLAHRSVIHHRSPPCGFGGLALPASRLKSPLHGCLLLDRSLAADRRASIARKAEMRKINRCVFGHVSRPVALSPQTTFSLASSQQARLSLVVRRRTSGAAKGCYRVSNTVGS